MKKCVRNDLGSNTSFFLLQNGALYPCGINLKSIWTLIIGCNGYLNKGGYWNVQEFNLQWLKRPKTKHPTLITSKNSSHREHTHHPSTERPKLKRPKRIVQKRSIQKRNIQNRSIQKRNIQKCNIQSIFIKSSKMKVKTSKNTASNAHNLQKRFHREFSMRPNMKRPRTLHPKYL